MPDDNGALFWGERIEARLSALEAAVFSTREGENDMPQPTHPPAPSSSVFSHLGDIERYWSEISTFLGVVKGAGKLAVGASEPTPDIKIDAGGHRYTWHASTITKDS